MRVLVNRFLFCLIYVIASVFVGRAVEAGEIQSVVPTGAVKQVQQVTVRFSTDMVPMGDPRSKTDPLVLECKTQQELSKKKGKAGAISSHSSRWIDSKSWSLDFDKGLPSGIRCSLKPAQDLKDLAGQAVTGLPEYTFSTGGPALLGVAPRYGDIEPEQYFVLQLDGPMNTDSVEKLAYFESGALADKIGVRVVTGSQVDAILRAAIRDNWNWNGFTKYLNSKTAPTSVPELKGFVVVAGTRRFPEGSRLVLHWPAGILSASMIPVEEPQSFEFNVIEPFSAKFACDRTNPERPCNPILDMHLSFSRRVPLKLLKGAELRSKSGEKWAPVELAQGDQNQNGTTTVGRKTRRQQFNVISNFSDEEVDSLTFKAPLPPKTELKLVLPAGVRDELGRALENEKEFPLAVATDEYSPLIKFAAPFGLLELNADPALPVSLRNVEKSLPSQKFSFEGKSFVLSAAAQPRDVINLYSSLLDKDADYAKRGQPFLQPNQGTAFEIPKPGGVQDFELVGIPMKTPGLHVVEMKSAMLGSALLGAGPMYVASAALVTDLAVHFKKGRESSAVWVTRLSDAHPVAEAEVALYDHAGAELAKGKTDSSGIWRTGSVKYPCRWDKTEDVSTCEVFAFAKKADDFSFVSSAWSKGIEDYRFNLMREYLAPQWGPLIAHSVMSRAILQAGEAIDFKHILREHTENGFRAPAASRLPKRVYIVHRGSHKIYSFPFAYDKTTGTATTHFQVPKNAALGTYAVYLSREDKAPAENSEESSESDSFDWNSLNTANFVVSQYRLPLMESTVKIEGEPLLQPREVKVDLSARYLSGGPASGLKTKIRAALTDDAFTPDIAGAADFGFFGTPTKAGIVDEREQRPEETHYVYTQDLTLGADGGAPATIKEIPLVKSIKSLTVEMEYKDPNGETKTSIAHQTLFPSDAIVGLRAEDWMSQPGKAKVAGVIVDHAGHILAKHAYTVQAFLRESMSHRKRIVGGFYAYDSQSQTTSLGQVCKGESDDKGRFNCEAPKLPSGTVILEAKVADGQNRATYASVELQIAGEDAQAWWAPSDSDRIDLIAEKPRYEPGETARLTVRSPFPKSTVLITVEREGVLEAFVKEITRDQSTIDVPLKGHYAPNVFISALAIRGRVGEPQATGLVDLARPSIKLGMTELRVGWKEHELKVSVETDKKRYLTRDKAQVAIHVTDANGKPMPAGAEVAVVAVDEALGRLRKNWSLDLLTQMMGQRGLAVDTSAAENQVIGRRHFGAKAKPPGGGGGISGSGSREFFNPMLLWSPHVKLDAGGNAHVTVVLNDSITSFQIAAVAQAAMDHFGMGSTRIEASKDLIVYPGFAPVVRDGDQIQNVFTVRNTTDHAMNVQVTVKSTDNIRLPTLAPLALKPNEAKTISIPVTVPPALAQLNFELAAKDQGSIASDSVKVVAQVQPSVPDRVLQATLFQLEKPTVIPVQQPKDALPGRGGLMVGTQDSLVRGLAGVRSYMEAYPYSCLEQQLSKAIALEKKVDVERIVAELPSYMDGNGLLKFFPISQYGWEQLSRYVLDLLDENSYKLPATTEKRALEGLQAYLDGKADYQTWWSRLVRDNYRNEERVLIMETLSRYHSFDSKSVASLQIAPNLWRTTTVAAWLRLLEREPSIKARDEKLKQAEMILRSRTNVQGTSMNPQGTSDWEADWHLFTSRDQEAFDVFGVAITRAGWEADAGRMARSMVARQKSGAWDNTMANAWGVTWMRKFSAKFEKEKVTGTTTVTTADHKETFDWKTHPRGADALVPWPKASESAPSNVDFAQQGTGKPWVILQTRSAIPLKSPMNFGYAIQRQIKPVAQKAAGHWSVGDVANIELTITAKSDQPWVVVRDPIPAGASILAAGLEDTSALLDQAPKQKAKVDEIMPWPSEYEEKSLSHFMSYAAYLQKGVYKVDYRVRLNSAGTFKLPPTGAEAMYSPEAFGETPNVDWSIAE